MFKLCIFYDYFLYVNYVFIYMLIYIIYYLLLYMFNYILTDLGFLVNRKVIGVKR